VLWYSVWSVKRQARSREIGTKGAGKEGRGGEKTKIKSRPVFKVLESDVMKDVDQVLSAYHIFHWRNNTGVTRIGRRFIRFGYPGSSDWLGICPDGRFLAVERKRPRSGQLTAKQRDFLDCISRAGGVAVVVTSVESLIQKLKEKGVV
jgi:hypothetical protein